jgi:O-antigen/teichoic acid export membrane protein
MSKTTSSVKASAALPSVRLNQDILTAAKGGGIAFAGNLFQYGVRFLSGFLLARFLGAEQLGLCNLAMTTAAIASGLTLLGLQAAVVRYVSVFANRRDTAGLWGTLQIGLGLTTIVSLSVGISLFVLADPIAEQLFHELRLAPLLRVSSLIVPFLALNTIIAAATQGFKKMQYPVIAQGISQPTSRLILAIVLAITMGLNATKALITYNVSEIIAFVILLYFLNALFSLRRPLRAGRRDTREMLRFGVPVYLSSLIQLFGGNIQTMLLGALSTTTSVGIFAVATQTNAMGRLFHGSIVQVSSPIVSELYDRKEWKQLERFYQTMTKWTFTLNLPLFLIVLLFPVPILSIFGQGFVDGAMALNILAWGNLVKAGTGICGVVLNMTGRTTLTLINSIVLSVLTIGLNILLIPHWGILGAATASLISVVLVNLLRLIEVFILFGSLPYNPSFVKPITAGLGALVAVVITSQLLPPNMKLLHVIVNVIILLGVYATLILLLGLSSEDRTVLARLRVRARAILTKN